MSVYTELIVGRDYAPAPVEGSDENYLPLIEGLTIKESPIHGLGLYAIKHFAAATRLGITHVRDERFPNGYSRTPLGGFYNHNGDDPNCVVVDEGDFRVMYTLEELQPGTEVTVRYKFYDPSQA